MQTPIGHRLRDSRRGRVAACCMAVLAVGGDFALVKWADWLDLLQARWAIALVALAGAVWSVGGDLPSIGLNVRPIQGWRYWIRATAWIALAVAVIIAGALGALVLGGYEPPIYTTHPDDIGGRLLAACIYAPLLEETLYRLVLCVPLAAACGAWPAIAVSGVVFGALHVVYGNPSPENLCGGWFLAWAYLKSGAISVPLLLHGLGNLVVVAGHAAAWYWINAG